MARKDADPIIRRKGPLRHHIMKARRRPTSATRSRLPGGAYTRVAVGRADLERSEARRAASVSLGRFLNGLSWQGRRLPGPLVFGENGS